MNNSSLFQAFNVNKNIGSVSLLQNISLEIHKGKNTAIISHNGSGKSSLLKLIAGIYEPTSGQVKRSAQKIAYVPEHFPENIRFKMREYLLLIGEMSGRSKIELNERIMHYADIFFIQEHLETPLRNCSKGTKQKAGLIQALLTNPDLLLLDEPLSGLDPDSQMKLVNQLTQLKTHVTIVFTAHEQVLVDQIADCQLELKNGRLIDQPRGKINSRKVSIKARVSNKGLIQDNSRLIEVHSENNNIATFIVEETEADQVLLDLLNSGASILEVTARK